MRSAAGFPIAREGDRPNEGGRLELMARFHELGRQRQWSASDVAWHLPLVAAKPMTDRRRAVWGSVVMQQLQADEFAVRIGAQLLAMSEDLPATLYYRVMAEDESRHVEIWMRMLERLGGGADSDPYIREMGDWVLDVPEIELKVLTFQVFFEGMAIGSFREIASMAPGTTLADVCVRLARDDTVHHGFGRAYASKLLERASPALIQHINRTMASFWPLYRAHTLWRPPERRWLASLMSQSDRERVARRSLFVRRTARQFGLSFAAEA